MPSPVMPQAVFITDAIGPRLNSNVDIIALKELLKKGGHPNVPRSFSLHWTGNAPGNMPAVVGAMRGYHWSSIKISGIRPGPLNEVLSMISAEDDDEDNINWVDGLLMRHVVHLTLEIAQGHLMPTSPTSLRLSTMTSFLTTLVIEGAYIDMDTFVGVAFGLKALRLCNCEGPMAVMAEALSGDNCPVLEEVVLDNCLVQDVPFPEMGRFKNSSVVTLTLVGTSSTKILKYLRFPLLGSYTFAGGNNIDNNPDLYDSLQDFMKLSSSNLRTLNLEDSNLNHYAVEAYIKMIGGVFPNLDIFRPTLAA